MAKHIVHTKPEHGLKKMRGSNEGGFSPLCFCGWTGGIWADLGSAQRALDTHTASKAAPTDPWNEIDFIIRFEQGAVTEEELIEGFQHLIDNGHAWTLQGFYGRTARDLIVSGKCHPRTGARHSVE